MSEEKNTDKSPPSTPAPEPQPTEKSPAETASPGAPPPTLTGRARSLQNLRPPFKPGERGNPHNKNLKGRPKIADRLERWGKLRVGAAILRKFKKAFPDIDTENMDADDVWTQRVLLAAILGESWAATFIAERREGKVKQEIGMSGRMGLDLHDLSDDELERRIEDATRRAAALAAGEAAPAGS